MKKIFVIIFSVLIAFGCIKEEVLVEKDAVVKKPVITEVKEYYVGRITYVNHDDYFEHSNKVDSDKRVIQAVNNEVIEENISNEPEIINNVVEESIKENVSVEEVVDSNILVKEDIKINEEDDETIEEKLLVIEDTTKEELSSNTEFEDNNISEEEKEIENEVINEELEVSNEIKTGYYAPNGNYLGETKVKVIDVSYYQGHINWDIFASESDCYGVILRLGYYDTLDKTFERNITELKRLNIPYGIYLFSYATTLNGSNKEALFTNEMISKYELNPALGIYYDIESWSASNGASSNDISKEEYDIIISNYINKVSSYVDNKYKVRVYSGRWYAMNRLGTIAKSYVDWVAEYNSTLKYDSSYTMWQYTSKGSVPGINGNVDISYLY